MAHRRSRKAQKTMRYYLLVENFVEEIEDGQDPAKVYEALMKELNYDSYAQMVTTIIGVPVTGRRG